jgi:hypothetical protein
VAANAHQNGSVKSATNPSTANVSQNIFRCMVLAYREIRVMLRGRHKSAFLKRQCDNHGVKSDWATKKARLGLNNRPRF